MLKLLPALLGSLALVSFGTLAADEPSTQSKGSTYQSNENKADPATTQKIESNASSGGPVKPDLGAGPHGDRSAQTSGAGSGRSGAPKPVTPGELPSAGQSEGGGASAGPSKPDTVEQQEDEKKASRAKEKMKRKPGYQEEVPSPRASH